MRKDLLGVAYLHFGDAAIGLGQVAREQEGRLEEAGLDAPDILGRGEFQARQQAPVKQVAHEHAYDQAKKASHQQTQQTTYHFAEKHGTPQVARRGTTRRQQLAVPTPRREIRGKRVLCRQKSLYNSRLFAATQWA